MKLIDMGIPDVAAIVDCCNQKYLIVKKHVMVKYTVDFKVFA